MLPIATAPRYLALGDSYTCGEGVAADECWPAQLVRALRQEAIPVGEAQIIAVTGWTTGDLDAAMDAASLQPAYDLVSLQIGVNNQYRGQDAASYRTQFAALLAHALTLADSHARRVLVVSIPDWGHTPYARAQGRDSARVARELDHYNALARAETDRTDAQWVDITGISRRPVSGAIDTIGADGLHPTAAQYAEWVTAILPAARAALR